MVGNLSLYRPSRAARQLGIKGIAPAVPNQIHSQVRQGQQHSRNCHYAIHHAHDYGINVPQIDTRKDQGNGEAFIDS
jgi:hypothetical protein